MSGASCQVLMPGVDLYHSESARGAGSLEYVSTASAV